MQSDQGQDATTAGGDPLPGGWAYGRNSVKAHYFRPGNFTSLCGKCVSNNGRQRNDRKPIPNVDCQKCQDEYHAMLAERAALND